MGLDMWKDILKSFNWMDDSRFVDKYITLKQSLYNEVKGTPDQSIVYHIFVEVLEPYLDKITNEHDLYDKGVPYIVFKIDSLSSEEWNKDNVEKLFSGLF